VATRTGRSSGFSRSLWVNPGLLGERYRPHNTYSIVRSAVAVDRHPRALFTVASGL